MKDSLKFNEKIHHGMYPVWLCAVAAWKLFRAEMGCYRSFNEKKGLGITAMRPIWIQVQLPHNECRNRTNDLRSIFYKNLNK